MTDEQTVERIDKLRFKAFLTNKEEDIESYYKAASKYFQGHTSRALERSYREADIVAEAEARGRNAALREAAEVAEITFIGDTLSPSNRISSAILALIDTETDPQPDLPRTSEPQAAPEVTVQQAVREEIVDTIEDIISETHDIDVTDRRYAENIVAWLERHHPAALRAVAGEDQP